MASPSSLEDANLHPTSPTRRRALGFGLATAILATDPCLDPTIGISAVHAAEPPRQLELCLVSILRVIYWAEGLSQRMRQAAQDGSIERQKEAYLEARLGAKASLTAGKVALGSAPNPTGATNIFMLSTLQLDACLRDLQTVHNTQPVFATKCRDWKESLANLVEFDGMDTLQDPSPRSSLALAQWTEKKSAYVQRLLEERVVALGSQIIGTFPTQSLQISRNYVQRYYPDEIPELPKTNSEM
ncbi:hypothetical protein ACA910_020200 [Epithemia clementina (nom. ined.)]